MTTQSIYKSPAGERVVMGLYDEALARWPVPYEAQTISTRHGDTYVISSGELAAPPMVLLHGAGTNSAIWAGDVAVYSQHFRVYAVDLLGEAGRSAPNRPDWHSPAYAEWLVDAFDGLQIDQAVLLGVSQGGWTALKFATGQPERVRQLVLLCPGGVVATRASFLLKAIPLAFMGKWGDGTEHVAIKWIMDRQVFRIESDMSYSSIIKQMRESGGRALVVIDRDEKVCGIVTPYNILKVRALIKLESSQGVIQR